MKKLLSIFSSFGITLSSTLSIISCGTTDEQKAIDKAKNELNALKDLKVEMELTGVDTDKVIAEIKKLANYTKAIDGTTIKLDGNLKLEKNDQGSGVEIDDLKDDSTLYVIGKIVHAKEAETKADFKFTIKLVVKSIDKVIKQLSQLTGITFKVSQLLATNRADDLNAKLLADDKVKAIITGNVKLDTDKFTFKVGTDDANDTNLVEKAVVAVSGKIEVNGQKSDKEFIFYVKLEGDKSEDVKSKNLKSEDVKPENDKSKNLKLEDVKPENDKSKNLKLEDVKPENVISKNIRRSNKVTKN